MAKVVHNEKINDLSTPWEGYTGQRVEELIKTYLNDHDQKKVGDTLKKVWHAMAFLDNETGGGMHKNKQLKNGRKT